MIGLLCEAFAPERHRSAPEGGNRIGAQGRKAEMRPGEFQLAQKVRLVERHGALLLRELFLPVVQNERKVQVARHGGVESLDERDLPRGVVEKVRAAHDTTSVTPEATSSTMQAS